MMNGLFNALQYLHDNENMIHRDVKLENIVLGSKDDYSKVKLIDFGLATQSKYGNITDFAKCGTHLYRPPEQVSNIFSYAKVSNQSEPQVFRIEVIMNFLCFRKRTFGRRVSFCTRF